MKRLLMKTLVLILISTAVLFVVSDLYAQLPDPPNPPDPTGTGGSTQAEESSSEAYIPTLNEWGLLIFAILLAGVSFLQMKRLQPEA